MAKFDWDREAREARKRKRGSIPLWVDPAFVNANTRRRMLDLVARQQAELSRFDLSDDINKVLNARTMRARLQTIEPIAVSAAQDDEEADTVVLLVRQWHAAVGEHVRREAARARVGKR